MVVRKQTGRELEKQRNTETDRKKKGLRETNYPGPDSSDLHHLARLVSHPQIFTESL